MDKKKNAIKVIVGIVIALAIAALVYFFVIKPKKEAETEMADLTGGSGTSGGATSSSSSSSSSSGRTYTPVTVFDNSNPIGKGMQGVQIEQLQSYLNKNFNANLQVDGKWWTATESAFLAANFKADNGQTYTKLTKALYDKLGLSNY